MIKYLLLIIFRILAAFSISFGENLPVEEKFTCRFEDDEVKLRYIYNTSAYSLAILDSLKSSNTWGFPDFSFTSERITAGRVNIYGFWRELINPFGYSSASFVTGEEDSFRGNFNLDSGSKYGGYIFFPESIRFVFLITPNPWVGVSGNLPLSDIINISLYTSLWGKEMSYEEDWTADYLVLPVSELFTAGVRCDVRGPFFDLDMLLLRSGNRYFRSGNLVRIFSNISLPFIDFRLRLTGADRDYITPPGKKPPEMFSVDSLFSLIPSLFITIPLEYEYKVKYPIAFPAANVETSIKGKGSFIYKAGNIKVSVGGEAEQTQETSGITDKNYSVKGLIKYFTNPFDITLSGGEKGNGEGPFLRWGELYFNMQIRRFKGSARLRLAADSIEEKKLTIGEKYTIGLKFDTGTLDVSCSFEPGTIESKYISWVYPDHLSITWNQSVFFNN